jgi:hypothetical protein
MYAKVRIEYELDVTIDVNDNRQAHSSGVLTTNPQAHVSKLCSTWFLAANSGRKGVLNHVRVVATDQFGHTHTASKY